MKKCLIIRKYGNVGDLLMITPSLRTLSQKYEIEIAVADEYQEVFYNLPYIKKVLRIDKIPSLKKFNKIIDLSDFEYNYERVNQPHIEKNKIELFAEAMSIQKVDTDIDIILSNEEKKWIEKYLHKNKLDVKKIIIMGIRSTSQTRDWPLDYWKGLIERLKRLNYSIIIADKELDWEDRDIFFFKGYTLRELFALISKANFIICNDSGLLHIGGAFKKPTLTIFGPTDPKVRSIYFKSHKIRNNLEIPIRWYQRSKEREDLYAISVDEVERSFLEIIKDEF